LSVSLPFSLFRGFQVFLFPGFSLEEQSSLVSLTRVLLLSPIILGLSNLLGSVTQTFRRFFVYALSPVLYNLGIILGILFFYPTFGLLGLGYGVVLGASFSFLDSVSCSGTAKAFTKVFIFS